MAAAGCQLHEDLTQLAVMWLLRVLLNLHRFWALLGRADRYFRHHRPDAVVLIDYPGFNWWIARRAKAHGIPVFYYGTPQMWAWAPWRVHKMRRLVDHVLCKLPFEEPWYRERGCQATYVGHPYFDELASQQLDRPFLADQQRQAQPLVTILPGSRDQEVQQNLPALLQAASLVKQQVGQVRFAIAAFNGSQAQRARELVDQMPLSAEVHVGRTPELIEAAHCCLACSGSVSLELLYRTRPTVIHYRIGRLAWHIQRRMRHVRFITLVNLLATKRRFCQGCEDYDPDAADAEPVPFPEYLTSEDRAEPMARHLIRWLQDESAYRQSVAWLQHLKAQYGQSGASTRAAEYLLEHVVPRPQPEPRPHYLPRHAA